jgi:hypothetical protein
MVGGLLTIWRQAVNPVHHKICKKLFPQYAEFDECGVLREAVAMEACSASRDFMRFFSFYICTGPPPIDLPENRASISSLTG